MGIVFCYRAVPPDILERARRDSLFVEAITWGEEKDARRLLPPGCERIDIDKAWDGIWYLLSAERRATDDLYAPADLLGQAVDGEEILNDGVGEGYSCPRYVSATGVKEIAAALRSIGLDSLQAQFDPAAMRAADVYPGDWAVIGIEYALRYFEKLRAFYLRTAEADQAVIVWGS